MTTPGYGIVDQACGFDLATVMHDQGIDPIQFLTDFTYDIRWQQGTFDSTCQLLYSIEKNIYSGLEYEEIEQKQTCVRLRR